jgi:hypothetical protein
LSSTAAFFWRASPADAGDKAARRYANFFGSIENDNTRAYMRACSHFFAWCDAKSIADLVEVEPFHVGAYLKAIGATHEKPTVKQHLAAIRMPDKRLLFWPLMRCSWMEFRP